MRTIEMTLDDKLIDTIDQISSQLKTSRSAFAINALQEAVEKYKIEQQHRQGYIDHPVTAEEFAVWEPEQAWGDSDRWEDE